MSSHVGTGVSGTGDPASGTIPAGAKDTTGAHAIYASIKWEVSGVTLSSVTDSKGNAWTIVLQVAHGTGGEPHEAVAVCLAPTNDASLVVTGNFSASTATFRRIQVEAFSSGTGVFAQDGVGKSGTGTASPYSTAALSTSGVGVVFAGVADFNSLGGPAAAGTPTFTIGPNTGDSFAVYLLSGSAQTVTPGATSTSGATRWVMVAGAIVEVSGSQMGRCLYVMP
jgi:hypothetical protein